MATLRLLEKEEKENETENIQPLKKNQLKPTT